MSGKGISAYTMDLSDGDYESFYFGQKGKKGKGKAKGVRSSGKGAGRSENPRGKDGQIMKCFGNNGRCNSTTHLKRDWPHETGNPGGAASTMTTASSIVYVDSYDSLSFFLSTIDRADPVDEPESVDSS